MCVCVCVCVCRSLAVPVTHCSRDRSDYQKQCYGGSSRQEIECRIFPKDSEPYDIDFRNQVYFGQFRSIGELVSCMGCVIHLLGCKEQCTLSPFNPLPPVSLFNFNPLPLPPVDAVFAVYEATSLELWSFFSYTASDGAPSHLGVAAIFYLTMVFYLVIFVQVSITVPVISSSLGARGINKCLRSGLDLCCRRVCPTTTLHG